jgi:hypothetical protein
VLNEREIRAGAWNFICTDVCSNKSGASKGDFTLLKYAILYFFLYAHSGDNQSKFSPVLIIGR